MLTIFLKTVALFLKAATLFRLRARGHFVAVVKTTNAVWDRSIDPIPVVSVATAMEALEADESRAPVRDLPKDPVTCAVEVPA